MAALGSSFMQYLQLCCIIPSLHLVLPSASLTFDPPPLRYDLSSATLWHCSHNLELSDLQGLLRVADYNTRDGGSEGGMEIIRSHRNWVDLISSTASKERLSLLGLHSCYEAAQLSDLVAAELRENLDTLQYHVADGIIVDSPENGSETFETVAEGRTEHVQGFETESEDTESEGNILERGLRSADGDLKQKYAFDSYLNFSAIKTWFEDFSVSHPTLVTLHPSIGRTYYERDIFAVHLTHKQSLGKDQRPKIYIQCLLHPREWISGPVCMYIAHQLAENSLFSDLLHRVEVVVVPVANPDGYYVTWFNYPVYRLWRKNLQPIKDSKCAGVDLNRNFDSHWSEESASQSDDPCDEVYRGRAANSALEVEAITRHLRSLGPALVGAIDFHSYSQDILYPPAWSDVDVAGVDDIRSVAQSVAAITSKVGVSYAAQRMVDIYSATGTLADWLLDLRNSGESCSSLVPLTVELRPLFHQANISMGFMLPKSQIYPTCTEMLIGFTEFAELVLDSGKNCYRTHNLDRP